MEERSTLKLIMEKGPREGETLDYPPAAVVTIGRVVRGNTIRIEDAGISSKHICIKFDHELHRWTLSDLGSTNGTVLNSQILKPYLPAALNDGDCIEIGELTSILVKIGVESTVQSERERKPRRQGKSVAGAASAAAVVSELGLGFDGDLAPVEKRNLRSRAKKGVEVKNEVESLSCSKRTLRSSNKEVKASLSKISEDSSLGGVKEENLIVGKKTRGGRKRKLPVVQVPPQEPDVVVVVVPVDGKKTRRGRKGLSVNVLEDSGLEENSNKAEESVRVDEAKAKAACDRYPLENDPLEENVEGGGLEGNLDTTNKSAQDLVAEKSVLMQEGGCEGKEAAILDTASLKGSSEVANEVRVDKGKQVAEEVECRQSGGEDVEENIGSDGSQWVDLEKMTLGDFFDCLMVQLPNEIREKSEEIISHLKENARKCPEFRASKK